MINHSMIKSRLFKVVPKSGILVAIIVALKMWQLCGMISNYWQMSKLIKTTFVSIADITDFYKSSGVFLISTMIQFVTGISQQKYIDILTSEAKLNLRQKLFEKVSRLGSNYKQSISSGQLFVIASEGIEQLESYYAQYMPQFFYSLLAPLFLFVIVYQISPKIAGILLAGVPVIPLSIVAVMKIAKRILGKYTKQYRNIGDSFLEAITGLTTLKIYGSDKQKQKQIEKEAESFRKMTMRLLIFQLNSISVMDVSMLCAVSFGFFTTLKEFQKTKITIGGLFFILFIAIEFYSPLRLMGSYFHIAMNGISQSEQLFKILDAPEPEEGTETLKDVQEQITLENISLRFDESKEVLKNVSIKIPHNQITCVVGASGSGKSTIANVLFKRLTNYSGDVKIGDQNIKNIRNKELYKHITMISTNSYVFQDSIEENLRLGKQDATKEELINTLKNVNLYEFVEQNGGLSMQINENASNISGGQRQRLALARALLADSSVYIFDEATSNIDVESEDMINNVIQELKNTKTIFLITHRLYNCIQADNIYVLANGEVVESGTHQELMEKQNQYYEMFKSQEELEQYHNRYQSGQQIIKINLQQSNNITRETKQQELVSKRQAGLVIMFKLILLIKEILPQIVFAVIFGILGFLCVIYIPKKTLDGSFVLISQYVNEMLNSEKQNVMVQQLSYKSLLTTLLGLSFLRGFFHYLEHYFNHYIAFRILAILRAKIFKHLRALAPAKLSSKSKGDLITTLTTDIEILEVFYAHTISPICISIGMTTIVTLIIKKMSKQLAIAYLVSSIWVSFGIPLMFSGISRKTGVEARDKFSKLSGRFLDTIKGIDEIIQYNEQQVSQKRIQADTQQLNKLNTRLRLGSGIITGIAYLSIAACVQTIIYLSIYHMHLTHISIIEMYTIIIIVFNSFGAQLAVANLTASHFTVLAAGDRVLKLLKEKPIIPESPSDSVKNLNEIKQLSLNDVSFSYGQNKNNENIINNLSVEFTLEDQIVGIHGHSGLGKSTILKLLMRFYDPQSGVIQINNINLKEIDVEALHKSESLVEQETILFSGSIADNIKVGKPNANNIEIIEAAEKAGLLDFIDSLPGKFETQIGELGDRLSSGERQRISLARAFLHNTNLLLLDEPTSNLDSLTESGILKQLDEQRKGKLIIIVSHRDSTLGICKKILSFE